MLIWIYSATQPAHFVAKAKPAHSATMRHSAKSSRVLLTSHSGSHLVDGPSKIEQPRPSILSPMAVESSFILGEPFTPMIRNVAPATFASEDVQPVTKIAEKLVTLNLSETPIGTVVSLLSKQTGINAILLSKTDQKVTINISQMPLKDALKHLATLAGLRSLKVSNAFIISEEASLKSAYPKEFEAEYGEVVKPETKDTKDPKDTNPSKTSGGAATEQVDVIQRIYNLKYQDATQVTNALKEYLGTHKVTITALPNTLLPNLGSAAGGANGSSGGATTSTVSTESRGKRVLLSGPAAGVQETMVILQQMDVPRKQVEITVTIHDVSNDALKDAGVTWDFGQSTITEAVNGNANIGTFSRTGLSFVGTIHALETANKAKLLASPNISSMDGVLSSILIGEKRRFPVVTGTTANGQFIYSTEEQNVGIYLLVAADITDDGTVTLAVNAQVSSILGFLQLNGGSYPQISTRESKSTLLLKDGQTMLMGGLLRDEDIFNLQKVPYLSQIPFFGKLFESRKTQKSSSQLLISITPHIIK